MAVPSRPADYQLSPNERYLKKLGQLLDDPSEGMTSDDYDHASDFAWLFIMSRLHAKYDTSSFHTSPPPLLYHIWDLIASATLMSLYANRTGTRDRNLVDGYVDLAAQGENMLQRIVSPQSESERITLIGSDGNTVYARSDVAVPEVRSPYKFFPDTDTYKAWGESWSANQSLEELFKQASMSGITGE